MNTINFSVIIPHKNVAELLQRCLDSIPVRDDIQVIVIDDNSDPDKVDFGNFPKWTGNNYECHFTKEGKGAGFARNVGLSKAKGKWVLFLDSDDLFTPEINSILDIVANLSVDVLYFCHDTVMSDDLTVKASRNDELNQFVSDYIEKQDDYGLRYMFNNPICKIISREFIEANQIKFDETRWSNDIYFSSMVGCLAKEIFAVSTVGYLATVRSGSLAYNFCGTFRETRVRLAEALKSEAFFKKHKIDLKQKESDNILRFLFANKSPKWMLGCCASSVFHPRVALSLSFFLTKRFYKKAINR